MRVLGIRIPRIRLGKNRWVRLAFTVLGLALFSVAVWIGGPMTGWAPLFRVDLRLLIILIPWLIWLTVVLVRWRRQVRAARALQDALVPSEPEGDGKVLAEKMEAALATLRKSGGASYLYELPWYVIIGPPGAGKTTALENSGIEFPLKQAGPVTGFGGTRDTDFWFSEEAVLIDTAGRYTTQDSDADGDKAGWTSFLELLKKHRPHQPINGVILAFSVEDMLGGDQASLQRHAETVRARLGEIHQTQKIDFPVYVMFTKADLIAGFREYFASFSQSRRNLVWGATFQTSDRKALTHESVPAEFDRLVARLSDEVIDRLAEEPDGISRIAIFNLPGQMALLRDNVADFLRRVFEPTRYKTTAILRGFYFTSGTQEGTPIDQVLGALNPVGGDINTPAFMFGRGKSYFIHDLLRKVIFPESGWVSHDRRAVRRAMLLRTASISAVVLVTVGTIGALGWSGWKNHQLMRVTEAEAGQYLDDAAQELSQDMITDPDLRTVEPLLNRLAGMSVGYTSAPDTPFTQGLGLGQRSGLRAAAVDAYGDALERMLRPRLILDLETRMPSIIASGDTRQIYRALKVYLLVTKAYLGFSDQGARPDDSAVEQWFDEKWREVYSSSLADHTLRENLGGHLHAMLDLGDTREPQIAPDMALIERAQQAIAQLPLDEQAWTLMLDEADLLGLKPWALAQEAGSNAAQVLATKDGTELQAVTVPGIYTYEGFWGYFFEALPEIGKKLRGDQWVLGDLARSQEVEARLQRLDRDLLDRYKVEFIRHWDRMLDNLTLNSMVADRPHYDALLAATAARGSPILDLVRAVHQETRLTAEYEDMSEEDAARLQAGNDPEAASVAGGEVASRIGDQVLQRARTRTQGTTRILTDAVLGQRGNRAPDRTGTGEGQPARDDLLRPVEDIAEHYIRWHEILAGDPGQRPIDALLANMGEVANTLRQAEQAPDIAKDQMPVLLSNLTRHKTQLPTQLQGMIEKADRDFREGEADASIEKMNRDLVPITQYCREQIAPLRPFGPGPRSLSIDNFAHFFGPGGQMDTYFNTYLDPLVERTPDGLAWRETGAGAGRLSNTMLLQFQRAERIRQAFFAGGGSKPSVEVAIAQTRAHPDVQGAVLVINGEQVQTVTGSLSQTVEWPGKGKETVLQLQPVRDAASTLRLDGSSWTLIDLLRNASSTSVRGDTLSATFTLGGRWITYDFTINAVTNPFLMRELQQFECPVSVDG